MNLGLRGRSLRRRYRTWLFVAIANAAAAPTSRMPSKPPGKSTSCSPRRSSSAETKLAPRVDDATYLRRVWLDIVGDIPSPEHVTAFLLDPATDKRERSRQRAARPIRNTARTGPAIGAM